MRLIFPDATPFIAAFYDAEARTILPELIIECAKPSPAELVERLRGADAAILFQTKVDDHTLSLCERLKAIVVLSTGVGSWIDVAAAARRNVVVRGVAGYGDRTVAEHALALILACSRRIPEMDRAIRAGHWQSAAHFELAGKTLAVIGLGATGKALARLGHALGLRVVGWNRSPVTLDIPVGMLPLDAALQQAHIVSLHLALHADTRGLLSADRLAAMRPDAILINTARGALLDTEALIEALRTGRLAAAGLDVFAEEPLPVDHPLTRLDNVVLSAHAAWHSPEAGRRLLHRGLQQLADILATVQDR
jgi:D-3-phosphoglycerate dehydrogenase